MVRAVARRLAHAHDRRVEIETLLMENAWPLFQAGDEATFSRQIAAIILATRPRPDAIVLAQASMAPAAQLLKQSPVPVFSSPRLGVAAALRRLGAKDEGAPARIEQGRTA